MFRFLSSTIFKDAVAQFGTPTEASENSWKDNQSENKNGMIENEDTKPTESGADELTETGVEAEVISPRVYLVSMVAHGPVHAYV